MDPKTSATSLFRTPLGTRAATAFLSGSAAAEALAARLPPDAHAIQH